MSSAAFKAKRQLPDLLKLVICP